MNDFTETIEAPDAEVHSITDATPPAAPYNSLLRVFDTILSGAEAEREESISPAYAQRIVGRHVEVRFKDMVAFHEVYFNKIAELYEILKIEIAAAGDNVEAADAEEDVALNSEHFKNLLLQWQLAFQSWELEWHPMQKNAAVDLAATSEAFTMFFGQTGLTQFFGEINFNLDEDDQRFMAEALIEAREGK